MSAWIDQIFEAGQVAEGNIVRRAIADVQKYASEQELLNEVEQRAFHLLRIGGQFVIICNTGELQVLV